MATPPRTRRLLSSRCGGQTIAQHKARTLSTGSDEASTVEVLALCSHLRPGSHSQPQCLRFATPTYEAFHDCDNSGEDVIFHSELATGCRHS